MKITYKNFTTLEQSEQLLKLGVPTESADGIYIIYNENTENEIVQLTIPNETQVPPYKMVEKSNQMYQSGNVSFHLCWSVGKLLEMMMLCCLMPQESLGKIICSDTYESYSSIIDVLLDDLEYNMIYYDFSKLKL